MWVGTQLEGKRKQKEEYNHLKKKIQEEIIEHFGGTLTSVIVDQIFGFQFLIKYGTELLTNKFGFCECCNHYIGVTENKRKLFNISVLNSYCKEIIQTVKPNNRCRFWEPSKFNQQLIQAEIKRISNNNPECLNWLFPHKPSDDELSFKEEY